MAPLNSQTNRNGRLYTPLPENTLSLMDFSGIEAVNEINNFKVKAFAADGSVDIGALIGQPMRVELDTVYGKTRYFHQGVFAARSLGLHDHGFVYEFELRPWIWMMSRQSNSRIFEELSVTEIITEVMAAYTGMFQCPIENLTQNSFPKLHYTVQYAETDLDFMLRLLEQFNISYFVKMSETGQSLVLVQDGSMFTKTDSPNRIFMRGRTDRIASEEVFDHWTAERILASGQVRTTDYNFEMPNANLDSVQESAKPDGTVPIGLFEYPGVYLGPGEGDAVAKGVLDALLAKGDCHRATGEMRSLGAGMKFELTEHTESGYLGGYLVMSAHHMYTAERFQSGSGTTATYRGNYRLYSADLSFAPDKKTPRPVMRGPQTAVVVDGADGSIDGFGRIVVQFHWDKSAKSMRCRVAQMWASKEWGTMFTPHIGMEVIVEFLDGNPDRPVVTGCVYNDNNMPPWPLPDKKLTSGILTVRDNWLLFDDTEGAEVIDMHAQKDFTSVVENDETHEVKNNSTKIIRGTRTVKITKDSITTIDGKLETKVKGDVLLESDTKITLKVGGSTIVLEPGGIKIDATKIDIAAVAALTTKGLTAEHTSSATMTIKSAMVLIN